MENSANNMVHNSANLIEEVNISQEAISIIDKIAQVEKIVDDGDLVIDEEAQWKNVFLLMVSLYAKRQNANVEVLDILENYNIDLTEAFSEDELSILQKEYKEVIKYCALFKFNTYGEYKPLVKSRMIPTLVVELCEKLVSVESGSDVLLAHSRMGQFAFSYNNCKYYGYEETPETWAFSQIMFDAFDITADIRHCQFDEFFCNAQKKYDYIFLNCAALSVSGDRECDELVSLAKNYLKENGQMFCILPSSLLVIFNKISSFLADSVFESIVIELPNDIYCDGTSNDSILCLKKKHIDRITLVDATGDTIWNNGHCHPFANADEIIEAIRRKDDKYVWVGTSSDLKDDNELIPSIRLIDQNLLVPHGDEKIMKVGDLVEVVKWDSKKSDTDMKLKFVQLFDLTTDYLHCDIEDNVMVFRIKETNRLLESSAMLFGRNGKVARFRYKGEPLDLDNYILPFRLKHLDVITEEFLLRALTKKETLKQLDRNFNNWGLLYPIDLSRLKILVPSLERQKQLVADDKTIWEMQHETIEEKNKRYQQVMWLNDAHIRNSKHTLSGDIMPLRMGIKRLDKFFANNPDGIKLSSIIGRKTNQTIEDLLKELLSCVDKMSKDIESLTKSEIGEEEVMNVAEAISSYCDNLPEEYKNLFSVKKLWSEEDENICIQIHRDSLFELLENIVNNAVRHGFVDAKEDYMINFSVKITEDRMCRISIENNGRPMSERALRTFFERGSFAGETGHSGIGGARVYEICDKANGKALPPENKDGYVVISVELPLVSRD